MIKDGPRRQGRFIKSGSKVMDKVALVDFSFKEINEAKVITPDNAKRSIIHSSFHEEAELEDVIASADKINDNLAQREHTRAVIFPTDFTKEWERDKKLRKDRVARQDDDDDDLELEVPAKDFVDAAYAVGKEAPSPRPASAPGKASPSPVAKTASGKGDDGRKDPSQVPAAGPWQSMDVVGKAIKDLKHPDEMDALPHEPLPATPPAAVDHGGATDSFIPVGSAPTGKSAPVDPEAIAADEYKLRVEALKANEQRLAELAEEAKAAGYRDGFRMGEEKAELQARQNASQLFGKVSELIKEFAGLKHEILGNVQENFYELCQAMAESLIKREFSVHPETFVTVLRRAIDEAVEPGKFKIKVNPDTFDRVAGLGSSEILDALVRDKEIPPGDFKIESQMSVVDVSVSKMITELLQQADLSLFQAQVADDQGNETADQENDAETAKDKEDKAS